MPSKTRVRGKGDGSYSIPVERQPVMAAKNNPKAVSALGKNPGNRRIY